MMTASRRTLKRTEPAFSVFFSLLQQALLICRMALASGWLSVSGFLRPLVTGISKLLCVSVPLCQK